MTTPIEPQLLLNVMEITSLSFTMMLVPLRRRARTHEFASGSEQEREHLTANKSNVAANRSRSGWLLRRGQCYNPYTNNVTGVYLLNRNESTLLTVAHNMLLRCDLKPRNRSLSQLFGRPLGIPRCWRASQHYTVRRTLWKSLATCRGLGSNSRCHQ